MLSIATSRGMDGLLNTPDFPALKTKSRTRAYDTTLRTMGEITAQRLSSFRRSTH